MRFVLTLLLSLSLLLAGNGPVLAAPAAQVTLRISAGVGLKDALQDLRAAWVRQHPDIRIDFNFAAAGFLRKQIEEGAPVDIFLAPGRQHIKALVEQKLTVPDSAVALLGNDLALIVAREQRGRINGFSDLVKAHNVALGLPEMVPAGRYAKQTLSHFRLWEPLAERMVFGKSVRQVLAYVESGDADAGLVFTSDTKLLRSAAVAAVAPADSHAPIVFSLAAIPNGRNPQARTLLWRFLQSPAAGKIFTRHGFRPLMAEKAP
jgi:molybdate transport system substrate-binding protein